jgi:hypothetical protein
MLRARFQVSASVPSTNLGGVECHNSSGAQHRAYWSANDCIAGDWRKVSGTALATCVCFGLKMVALK